MTARPILACTDLSTNALPAIQSAAWYARLLGCPVTLAFVVDPVTVIGSASHIMDSRRSQLRHWANEQLRGLHASLFKDMEVQAAVIELSTPSESTGLLQELTHINAGHGVSDALCQAARDSQAQAIVMGTHGHSGVDHRMVGGVALRVARQAPCDVLTVRPQAPDVTPPDTPDIAKLEPSLAGRSSIRHILCPVDFSDGSLHALERAIQLAAQCGTDVHVLHTYQAPFWIGPDAETVLQAMDSQVQATTDELLGRYEGRGVKLVSHIARGKTSLEVERLVHALNIDLVVMGRSGQRGLKELALGGVTERVIRICSRPVLTVHNTP